MQAGEHVIALRLRQQIEEHGCHVGANRYLSPSGLALQAATDEDSSPKAVPIWAISLIFQSTCSSTTPALASAENSAFVSARRELVIDNCATDRSLRPS
jgi:hypothetical protein